MYAVFEVVFGYFYVPDGYRECMIQGELNTVSSRIQSNLVSQINNKVLVLTEWLRFNPVEADRL